jgi:hypothetical protein
MQCWLNDGDVIVGYTHKPTSHQCDDLKGIFFENSLN